MADNARPPFRADHVGSLLRPKQVLQARESSRRARSRPSSSRRLRTQRSAEIIRMQGEVGLKSATDGELRRQSWHMDFIYQLGGITKVNDDTIRVSFHSKDKNFEYAPPSAHVTAPISLPETIFAERVHVPPRQRDPRPDRQDHHPVAQHGALPGRPVRDRRVGLP